MFQKSPNYKIVVLYKRITKLLLFDILYKNTFEYVYGAEHSVNILLIFGFPSKDRRFDIPE